MTADPSAAEIHGRDFPVAAVVFEEGDPGSRMAFLRYVELRARWAALAAGEVSEVPDLASEGPEGIAGELLLARLGPEGPSGGRASGLAEDLAPKRRVEPEDARRNSP